jgi:hypothetical protein
MAPPESVSTSVRVFDACSDSFRCKPLVSTFFFINLFFEPLHRAGRALVATIHCLCEHVRFAHSSQPCFVSSYSTAAYNRCCPINVYRVCATTPLCSEYADAEATQRTYESRDALWCITSVYSLRGICAALFVRCGSGARGPRPLSWTALFVILICVLCFATSRS